MKSRILGAASLLVTLLPGTAAMASAIDHSGRSDVYLGLSGDATWLSDSTTGGGGNIAGGYRMRPGAMGDFRVEAEMGYHGVPQESGFSGNTHYYTYMGNAYYDMNLANPMHLMGWRLVPYVGAGVGATSVRFSERQVAGTSYHNSDVLFAYQFMGGLSLSTATTPGNMDWFVGYRYVGSERSDADPLGRTNRLDANNVQVGLRLYF